MRTIISGVGGINRLNEYLGYANVRQWTNDEIVEWGARVMRANDGLELTRPVVDVLVKDRRGPGPGMIARRFRAEGKNWQDFKVQVEEEYQRSRSEQIAARSELIERCSPQISDAEKEEIARTISSQDFEIALLTADSNLTSQKIDGAAIVLGIFDTIFPYDEHLKVAPEQLAEVREKEAARIRASHRRSQERRE